MHHPIAPAAAAAAAGTHAATAAGTHAAAAQPVCAHTVVTTGSAGLATGTMFLDVAGHAVPVYHAAPAGQSGLPVVLVLSEIFGVHEHIADVARRFASQGYLALAPHLFVRQGDAGNAATIEHLMSDIVVPTPDADVLADLDACVAWAGAHGGDLARLAVTGFCWGGRITWLYAAHNGAVKAAVAWYGKLVGERDALHPRHPIDIAATLAVPVLGLYGEQDRAIALESVAQMSAALAPSGSGCEFVVYPDAGHAFYADYRPGYVAAAAQDGFARALAWFKAHGAA